MKHDNSKCMLKWDFKRLVWVVLIERSLNTNLELWREDIDTREKKDIGRRISMTQKKKKRMRPI